MRRRGRPAEGVPEALLRMKPVFHGVALKVLGSTCLAPSTVLPQCSTEPKMRANPVSVETAWRSSFWDQTLSFVLSRTNVSMAFLSSQNSVLRLLVEGRLTETGKHDRGVTSATFS